MKIYEHRLAPNPRRVRIFLAEKGIAMEYIQVDLKAGEHLSDEFRARNPFRSVPVLELDNGEILAESMSICRYFEELQPEPALLGSNPWERAQIDMWQRRMELNFFYPVAQAFRNLSDYWAGRITPNREWGETNLRVATRMFKLLDEELGKRKYIAGDEFSIADITALVAIDFAKYLKLEATPEQTHLKDWYERVASRPSAKA